MKKGSVINQFYDWDILNLRLQLTELETTRYEKSTSENQESLQEIRDEIQTIKDNYHSIRTKIYHFGRRLNSAIYHYRLLRDQIKLEV